MRYSSGEIALSAVDLETTGFGVPWGHTRSFASRLSNSESLGHGYNWQVQQWPYLIRDYYDNVVVFPEANASYWFNKLDGGFAGEFRIKETLEHDQASRVYRFYKRNGSFLEFNDFTGMF